MSKLRTANLLGALASEIDDRLERMLKRHPNQTDSSAAALNLIGFYEGCTNAQLSAALRLSHAATVRLLDRLEADGAVERRGAASDKRAVALHLTRKGRARIRDILVARCETLRGAIACLSAAEQNQLTVLIEKLLRNLTASAADADYICRLCDEVACPSDNCPVHLAAMAAQ